MGERLACRDAGGKEEACERRMQTMTRNTLLWALAFGALSFAAGFAFGVLRELVLIPALGERGGHLAEFPLVTLTAMAIGARIGWASKGAALLIGLGGALVLVALESALALGVVRMSLAEYFASYDLSRGALFPIGLMLMALSPLAGRRLKRR
jgi:hypothetical protein